MKGSLRATYDRDQLVISSRQQIVELLNIEELKNSDKDIKSHRAKGHDDILSDLQKHLAYCV